MIRWWACGSSITRKFTHTVNPLRSYRRVGLGIELAVALGKVSPSNAARAHQSFSLGVHHDCTHVSHFVITRIHDGPDSPGERDLYQHLARCWDRNRPLHEPEPLGSTFRCVRDMLHLCTQVGLSFHGFTVGDATSPLRDAPSSDCSSGEAWRSSPHPK